VASISQLPAARETAYNVSAPQRIISVHRDFGPQQHQVLLCHAASARGQICYYIGPSERQAKEMAWRALKQLVPAVLLDCIRESELELELVNGSLIRVHGPQSLRGTGLDFAMLDECAFMPAELWPEVVRPMLADREGRALLSSTPRGYNHFHDLFIEAQSRSDSAAFHFSTAQGGHVSEEELALLQSTMDPKLYAQEIEAEFELQSGRVYHAFSRDVNVTDVPLIADLPLLVGMDFNVNPMTAVVAQKIGEQCHVSGEIVLPNSNTFEMMQELLLRYPQQRGVVHPDPSGAARKTSAAVGLTDHAIIQQAGWYVYSLKPYAIVDRINSVNAMFENANRQRRLFIDRGCRNLIRALDSLSFKVETHIPDKSSGFDHITDALGYLIMGAFPMLKNEVTITQVFI
jgi:hypothetical protein